MELRVTVDELTVLRRGVGNETVNRAFAAQWARERVAQLRERRLTCCADFTLVGR